MGGGGLGCGREGTPGSPAEWAEPLRCSMQKPPPPLTPILGSAALRDGFLRSLSYFSRSPKGSGRLYVGNRLPPGYQRWGRVPFQSGPVKASPGSTISSFGFPSSAHMRQQVSRTQIIFSSPRERARFVSFCAIRRRPRRVWAAHGWVRGSPASGARWPAPSREGLGSGGLGRPASYPGRVWVTRAAPPSSMPAALLVAGVRPRDPPERPRWPPALTRSAPAGGR